MTLSFNLYHEGKPTFFPHYILWSLYMSQQITEGEYIKLCTDFYIKFPEYPVPSMPDYTEKKHTIRVDASYRWKPGMDIHFVVCNRTKQRYQFAPVVKCTSVQAVYIRNLPGLEYTIVVDGKRLDQHQQHTLILNDGLTKTAFHKWFTPKIGDASKGRIIHWTDINY